MKNFPDTHVIKNGLTESDCAQLNTFFENNRGVFCHPKLRRGNQMSLEMACWGWHWNAIDYKYYPTRIDHDNSKVDSVPDFIKEIAKKFSLQHFPYHIPDWDILIVNYYKNTAKLGNHVDNSESKEALKIGHPVVSFSIGASCLFEVSKFRVSTLNDEREEFILDHGDVLLFGGQDRLIYHQVRNILPTDNAFANGMDGGRVNFTLRKL
jgi:alkylated DNA repair dioxygenase AlkB